MADGNLLHVYISAKKGMANFRGSPTESLARSRVT